MLPWMSTARAWATDLPMSIDSISANSSALASIRSARRCSRRSRSSGLSKLQAPPSNCARAACTARSRSSAVPIGTRPSTPSVDGSITSALPPSAASSQAPPMNSLCGLLRKCWVASLTPNCCRYCLTLMSTVMSSGAARSRARHCLFDEPPCPRRAPGLLQLSARAGTLVEDETDAVEQQLRGQNRGDPGRIVGRRHLNQIHADDLALAALGQRLDDFQHLVVEEAAMAGGAGTGGDRGVEAIDVDGDVVIDTLRDQLQHALAAEAPHIAHREDPRAGIARGIVVIAVGRGHVADAQLGHADDVLHFRGAA